MSRSSTGEVQDVETQREVSPFDLEAFRCQLVAFFEDHRAKHFPNLPAKPVTVKRGRKYTRLFNGNAVYCFVEMASGDILKPEGLKKPAKYPRGNVHNASPLKCCGPYGVAYMRG